MIFSFESFIGYGALSLLTIGGYNENNAKQGKNVAWNRMIMTDNGKLTVKIKDIIFQNASIFSDTYSIAEIDHSTKLTLIPLKEMQKMVELL